MRPSIRHLCLALAAFFAAAGTSLAGEPSRARAAQANLTLLTWNIQMLPTAWDFASESLQKKQALRAPWIIEYLKGQDYDIVVLQEVIDRKISDQLKEGLKPRYRHIVAADAKLGVAGCSGGILFASRIPLKYVAHVVYKNITGIDKLAEKGCLLVEAEHEGVRFQIAGTHLQAGNDAVRDKEFAEIRDGILLPYQLDGVPQLLVGDMNVATAEDSFRALLDTTQMRDFPLDDRHPYTVDGKNSWNQPNKRPKHIDHVLLNSRGTASTIVRQTIQRARREHEGRTIDYADHYGVVADILIAK
jgi:endonuclease/exonuclease/phosphatase family metal-dependent hydrolase